ncbi:MAG: tRNA uridine-5-carboxymethylaminomethyl(34) synthesis GTPase MnmE [bacterium]
MNDNDKKTIAAIATPGGSGGVGIIRISGYNAREAAQKIVMDDLKKLEPRRATLCKFTTAQEKQFLDRGLIIYFPEPNSYTGEDVIELNCHGSPLLLDTLLSDILTANNVRLAEPGEFTRRAFLNHKLDLAQADAVAGIISARSRAALKSEARQLNGELSCLISQLRETLVFCRSRIEATLDFDEHDETGELPKRKLIEKLDNVLDEIQELIRQGQTGQLLADGCHTAIVGKPNVGKSSLFNSLLTRQKAIVTAQPGTTRDILSDQLLIDGIPFLLHDTAGIRTSDNLAEKMGVERSEKAIAESSLVIFLLDQSRPLNEQDDYIYQLINKHDFLVVINKLDLEANFTEKELKKRYGKKPDLRVSAETGEGLRKLKKIMLQKVRKNQLHTESPLVTRKRHLNLLENAAAAIRTAIQGLKTRRDSVLIAEDLRDASEATARITGEITTDDLLDEIFANFCIGK